MATPFVRRSAPLLAFGLAATLLACEDARVKSVDTGMTREQAISALAEDASGSGPDSMPNVYRRSEYLIDSKKYEVLYFTKGNEKYPRDTVEWEDLRPIVLIENRVVGKGWQYWDSLGKSLKIEVPKHED